ncbi:lysylphosphatidylglycerol synthase transmembrane domain-containing protein [Thermomicrobium sp. 4228-Ro]|uniref:lysylphosphatidylglycerol synthase transmembrane domain-containing protein n=1 Tax=Thermomicrobium sp. 4228-Ro TaxID=2993937 RepID=UPI002248B00A|nr:lysylphosphatidylglycerol synthase transmembrane domain-containing protein [Thermomicrobium sp. 4228-Ro]MCX2726258.1 lysylphosphatidylglycerol synthase transmembrane domain-containing protein [Thermomicrobium sp. 4228-Ro]
MVQQETNSPTTSHATVGVERLWGRIVLGIVFGIVIVAGLMVLSDLRRVLPALRHFDWSLFPLVLLLTAGNYACRFVKWELYLRWVGAPRLRRSQSLAVFLSGFAMSITPGKVGEWIKAFLVARLGGGPVAPVVPVVAVERLTDGIAMLILALVAGFGGLGGWQPLVVLAGMVLAGLWLVQEERVARPFLRLAARAPLLRSRAEALNGLYDATRAILRWRRLVATSGLSIFSWSLECLGLFVILIGVGAEPSVELLAVATFVLSVSSIAGALSLLPGGLGAAEAGITGLLLLLRPGMTPAEAATATVLIRFGTLWFGVLSGCAALLWLQRKVLRFLPLQPRQGAVVAQLLDSSER